MNRLDMAKKKLSGSQLGIIGIRVALFALATTLIIGAFPTVLSWYPQNSFLKSFFEKVFVLFSLGSAILLIWLGRKIHA